jgi:hypothetical protein
MGIHWRQNPTTTIKNYQNIFLSEGFCRYPVSFIVYKIKKHQKLSTKFNKYINKIEE